MEMHGADDGRNGQVMMGANFIMGRKVLWEVNWERKVALYELAVGFILLFL